MENELKYIEMVYRMGSFSKAARALYITQPALSIAIQKLENTIGMPIFDRSQKPIALTAAGRLYIEKIRQIRILESELNNQLTDLSSMNTGTIRIGATGYIISCILPPILMRFMQQYPRIRVDITEAGSYELRGLLLDQKIDLTFVSHLNKDLPFSATPAFQDQLILVVPASFPVNRKLEEYALSYEHIRKKRHWDETCPSPDLNAFADTPFILLDPKYNLRHRTDLFFEPTDFQPVIRLEVAQILTARSLAQEGLGAAFLPDRLLTEDLRNLVYYKVNHPQAVRHMSCVTNNRMYRSLSVQKFVQMLFEYN